jgi:hypothetical protein
MLTPGLLLPEVNMKLACVPLALAVAIFAVAISPVVVADDRGLAVDAGIKASISRQLMERELFVANGLYLASVGDREAAFLTAIAENAAQTGRAADETITLLEKVKGAIDHQLISLPAYAQDMGPPQRASMIATALLQSGLVTDLPITRRLSELAQFRAERLANQTRGMVGTRDGWIDEAASFNEFEQEVFSRAFDLYGRDPTFANVYDRRLVVGLRAKPGMGVNALMEASPNFAGQPLVKSIVDQIKSHADGDGGVVLDGALITSMKNILPKAVASLEPLLGRSIEQLSRHDLTAGDVALAIRSLDLPTSPEGLTSVENASAVGDARAGLFLAKAAVGIVDPKVAHDIGYVGDAALQFAGIVNAYSTGARFGPLAMGLGAAGLTGGALGATFLLTSLSPGSGSDRAVLDAISALQEQVTKLGAEMHARFDRVDTELNVIYADTMQQFALIHEALKGLKTDVVAIRSHLTLLDQRLERFEVRINEAINRLQTKLIGLQTEPCLAWRETTVTYSMPPDLFVKCLSRFRFLALSTNQNMVPISLSDIDLEELSAKLKEDAWSAERTQLILSLAAGFGVPLVPNDRQQDFISPADWIAAATSYIRVAQAWPEHYRSTPLRQLREIIERGQFLLDMLRNSARREVGGLLLKQVITKYMKELGELDGRVKEISEELASPNVRPTESWSMSIQRCDLNPRSPDGPDYYQQAAIQTGNDIVTSIPPPARKATRLGLGRFSWCVYNDNLGSDRPENASYTGPFQLLLKGVFDDVGNRLQLQITDLWLESSQSYEFPWMAVGPSIDNRPPVRIPFGEEPIQLIRKAWSDLLPKLQNPNTLGIRKDVLDDNHYPYKENEYMLEVFLQPLLSAHIYAKLQDQRAELILQELEKARLFVRSIIELTIPAQLFGSDAFSMLVYSGAPLVGSGSLDQMKASSVNALNLGALGDRRARAIMTLFENSVDAAEVINPTTTALTGVLRELETFFSQQVELCKVGGRNTETCQAVN